MAEEKIRFEDIFEGDIFKKAAESAQLLLNVLKEMDTILTKMTSESLKKIEEAFSAGKNAKNMQTIAREVQNVTKNYATLDYTQRMLERTEKRLNLLTGAQAKEYAKLRHEIAEANKDLRAYAKSEEAAAKVAEIMQKAQSGLFESYHDMSEALEKLRIHYKNLAATGKANTEEAKLMLNEIVKLDTKLKGLDESIGLYQRNVGSYLTSMRQFWLEMTAEATRGNGVLGSIIQTLMAMKVAFTGAQNAAKGLGAAIKVAGRAILASGILMAIAALSEGIGKLWDKLKAFVTGESRIERERKERERMEEDYSNEMLKLEIEHRKKLNEIDEAFNKGDIKNKEDYYRRKYEVDREYYLKKQKLIKDDIKASVDALKKEEEFYINKEKRKFRRNLGWGAGAAGAYGAAKYVDEKKIEEEAREALSKNEEYQNKRRNILNDILQKEKDLEEVNAEIINLDKEIKNIEIEKATSITTQVDNSKQLAQILNEIKELTEGLKVDTEEYANEIDKLNASLGKELLNLEEQQKKLNELKGEYLALGGKSADIKGYIDEFTKRLDEAREKLFKKYDALIKNVVDASIAQADAAYKSLADEQGKQIDAIKNKYEQAIKDIKKAIDNAFYSDLPTAKIDEMEKQIQELRLKQEEEISKVLLENKFKQLDIEEKFLKDTLILNKEEWKNVEEFEKYKAKRILDIQIDTIRKKLALLQKEKERKMELQRDTDETDREIALLTAQLRQLELQMRMNSNAAQDFTKNLKALAENATTVADAFSELQNKIMEQQEKSLERQQESIQRRISLLIAQTEKGSDVAAQSIAELEKKEAEIYKEQEELKKQAQKREAALGAFRAYAGQLEQGIPPGQALVNVIKDMTLLSQAIKALPVFHEGTEYVKGGSTLGLQDGIIARIHVGERIVPAEINRYLSGIKNSELPKLITQKDSVEFNYNSLLSTISMAVKRNNFTSIIKKRI